MNKYELKDMKLKDFDAHANAIVNDTIKNQALQIKNNGNAAALLNLNDPLKEKTIIELANILK